MLSGAMTEQSDQLQDHDYRPDETLVGCDTDLVGSGEKWLDFAYVVKGKFPDR